ncbi:MAG: dTDP-4-dehydrorhamnose 3,5-epimerase family protein [Verrucomicrobia bacterium]|nr:dTDP-4-dehydrorhamnose 3,5-epimerase family protein [Verrucomicrobiota bacterium]
MNERWRGLNPQAAAALSTRDYAAASLAERLATVGVEAGQLISAERAALPWIPGVEIFARTIHPQRHRGVFGEFVRHNEGVLAGSKLWPKQWAAARMFAGTAKGFHVHPPFIPEGKSAAEWMQHLFAEKGSAVPEYEREQWDIMFFVQGRVEIILRDVRAGLPGRTMRLFIDGDNHRSANNAGVIIPPGVAHALRVEGNEDVIMVYGTSTTFRPEFEGRMASDIETAELPLEWRDFLNERGKQQGGK